MNLSAVLVASNWIDALVSEAERDVVFAWHIAQGRFGGPVREANYRPDLLIKAVAQSLIERGCRVGFGNPDANSWEPFLIDEAPATAAEQIAAQWAANPSDLEFLVFAKREAGTSNQSLEPTGVGEPPLAAQVQR